MDNQYKKLIVGLSGSIAAGKTTIAKYLAESDGFIHLRSRNVLSEMLLEQGLEINENNLQNIGKSVVEKIGGAGLSELVLKDYNQSNDYVYDSIRHVKDLDYFRNRFGTKFKLLFVEAPEQIRRERYTKRLGRDSSEKSFMSRTKHPVENEANLLKMEASHVIYNDDNEIFFKEISLIIEKWRYF